MKSKITAGKLRYHGRVDVGSMIEPVAELRKVIIEDVGKYPDSMYFDADPVDFQDAMQRHLLEMEKNGVFSLDSETGLPHIYALGFNYMVLSMKYREELEAEPSE